MARRRRLEAPSADQLQELEAGFARETSAGLGPNIRPPIAQVAAEAASMSAPQPTAARAQTARDATDAARLRQAEAAGMLVVDIPIAQIRADELARDRMRIDGEEMDELRASIRAHGLRMPIEVFALTNPQGDEQFGLISGWRRLTAYRALRGEAGDDTYDAIRALVRRPDDASAAYISMVEENEIRAELSQYERGRVAVLAAGQGAFGGVEAAVDALFHAGSKAKRSKIRSFALIHEELGDLLSYGPALAERAGLRLAQALRAGMGPDMRQALATGQGVDAATEWVVLERLIVLAERQVKDPARGGRPKTQPKSPLSGLSGVVLLAESDARGHVIRLEGTHVNADMAAQVVAVLRRLIDGDKAP
jgi:ParB family chromosome partitioning protein